MTTDPNLSVKSRKAAKATTATVRNSNGRGLSVPDIPGNGRPLQEEEEEEFSFMG